MLVLVFSLDNDLIMPLFWSNIAARKMLVSLWFCETLTSRKQIFQQCPAGMLATASSIPLVGSLGLSEKFAARALAAASADVGAGLSDDPAVSNVALSVDLRKPPGVLTLADIAGSAGEADARGSSAGMSPTAQEGSNVLLLDSNASKKPGHGQAGSCCTYYGALASGKVGPSTSVEFVVREGSNEVDMAVPVEHLSEAQELPVEKVGFSPIAESPIPAILSVAGDGGGTDPPGGGASDKKETDKDIDAALAVAIAGKRQTLKDEFLRGIVEGRDTNVSFEEFPYYLRYMHFSRKDCRIGFCLTVNLGTRLRCI